MRRIAVIGAGVSGLAAARVLTAAGFEVVVHDSSAEVGGVWTRARSYPGVSTQDDRVSYAFSDTPMDQDFPTHPSGEHVRAYLLGYAERHGLNRLLRLRTEVMSAEPRADGRGWRLMLLGPGGPRTEDYDFVVAAHGTYSVPHVPDWPGREAFEAAGGRIVLPQRLGDGEVLRDRSVAVIGWGKTACDIATASASIARSTTVVARELRWKLPKRIGRLTFRHLLLTRGGEFLLAASRRGPVRFALAAGTLPLRRATGAAIARRVDHELGLTALGLLPRVRLADSNSLVTDGFYESVRGGSLQVLRDRSVRELRGGADGPSAVLSDGSVLQTDLLVPATGYEQVLDFLSEPVRERILEADGSLRLYRKVLPLRAERLAFIGWSQSYRSPLLAEVQAVWLAGVLLGAVRLPDEGRRAERAHRYQLSHRRAAANGRPQLPSGSFGELDELAADLGTPLPRRRRFLQVFRPLDPADYAYLLPRLLALSEGAPAATAGAHEAHALSEVSAR